MGRLTSLFHSNITSQWRTQGEGCRKMMLFPYGLFLATTFPLKWIKFNFSIEFYQKISKSQNFPNQLFFIQTRENLTPGF